MTEFTYKDYIIEYDINEDGELESIKIIDGETGETITDNFLESDLDIFTQMSYNHWKGNPIHTNIKNKLK